MFESHETDHGLPCPVLTRVDYILFYCTELYSTVWKHKSKLHKA